MERSGKYLWATDYRDPKSDVFVYGKIVKETKDRKTKRKRARYN